MKHNQIEFFEKFIKYHEPNFSFNFSFKFGDDYSYCWGNDCSMCDLFEMCQKIDYDPTLNKKNFNVIKKRFPEYFI